MSKKKTACADKLNPDHSEGGLRRLKFTFMARTGIFLVLVDLAVITHGQFPPQPDYLRSPNPTADYRTEFTVGETDPTELTLSNGLISRVFGTAPNFYTKDYRNEGAVRWIWR